VTDVAGANILFVTLDCCRYDTAIHARLPSLQRLGPIRLARTHGTYTLPAHMSFFMGYLPSVIEPPFAELYSGEVRQLWRLDSGRRRRPGTVAVPLGGDNVLDGYRAMGFRTIGAGGVRWFRHPALTRPFDEFYFYGETDAESVFAERKSNEFALNHIDDLLQRIGRHRYFLFVNCAETHCPYDFGDGYMSEEVGRTIRDAQSLWGFKTREAAARPVAPARLRSLQLAQAWALEAVEPKLESLIARLAKPLLVVVCGDHGECFGEDGQWGHGYPHAAVMDVPLLIGMVEQ
jgi:hypothetical protein